MNMEKLLASVKKHEGYRNKVYLDTLGKRTVGVGHLCVEDFWEDDKEYEEKFRDFFDEKLGFAIYTHLRLKDTNKEDFLHKDSPDSTYSLLVYLSETNLFSGTKLYDDLDNEVADIKFVQNRAIIFDSR